MNTKILRAIKDAYKILFNPLIEIYNCRLEKNLEVDCLFTIILSYQQIVLGGVISHRVGERFNSPTVNLFMSHSDCVKLICNLKHYMEYEPVFISTEYSYPVARVDDLIIHFNQYKSEEEAYSKWEERKKRIRYDRLYLIITAGDDLNKNELQAIERLEICNKVVFMRKRKESYDFIKVIKPHKYRTDGFHCMDRTLLMKWSFEKNFDYVAWLNEGMHKA